MCMHAYVCILQAVSLGGAKLKIQVANEYLGHRISAKGVSPTQEKIKTILEALKLKNVTQEQSFLGTKCTRSTYQSWCPTPYPWSPRLRGIIQLSRTGNVLRIIWLILQFGVRPNRLHHSLVHNVCKKYIPKLRSYTFSTFCYIRIMFCAWLPLKIENWVV